MVNKYKYGTYLFKIKDSFNKCFLPKGEEENILYDGVLQFCGAGAALIGRSRYKRAGSSSTAQAPAMTPCLKKRYNKNVNNNVN